MMYHAAFDVYALVPTVYENMRKSIKTEYLSLFYELSLGVVMPGLFRNPRKEHEKEADGLTKIRQAFSLRDKLRDTCAHRPDLGDEEVDLLR